MKIELALAWRIEIDGQSHVIETVLFELLEAVSKDPADLMVHRNGGVAAGAGQADLGDPAVGLSLAGGDEPGFGEALDDAGHRREADHGMVAQFGNAGRLMLGENGKDPPAGDVHPDRLEYPIHVESVTAGDPREPIKG